MATNIGVVGYGYWGSKHVRVLTSVPGIDVHVIDGDTMRRSYAGSAFPNVVTHGRLDEVLDDLDGIVIATPPSTHADLALEALDQGVHCLVEKPMALTTDDCIDLIDRAKHNDAVLMVGHTFEYNAGVWKMRELIEMGELGDVLYIDTARLNLGLYQRDVSVLWDLGPHDVSILNFLLRSTPNRVMAMAEAHRGPHADVATLILYYDEIGVTTYSRLSWLDPVKVRRVTVVGSRKMCVNNDTSNERIRLYDAGVDAQGPDDRFHEAPLEYRYGEIISPHVPFDEPLLVEDRHFVDCVAEGKQPDSDGYSGLAVVRVLEAAERSLVEGRTVEVQPVDLPALR